MNMPEGEREIEMTINICSNYDDRDEFSYEIVGLHIYLIQTTDGPTKAKVRFYAETLCYYVI